MSNSGLKSSGLTTVSESGRQEYSDRHLKSFLQSFLFFLLFYLYLWLYIDTKLIYHGAGIITNFPVFYKGWPFFRQFLAYPGGPADYLSAFLSQFFYYSWAGALVVTVQAWFLYLSFKCLIKEGNSPKSRLISFSLPILLLVVYTQYTYHFATITALLSALFTVSLYLKTARFNNKVLTSAGLYLIISVILYYVAGGAFILFAIICTIFELTFRSRWKLSLFYLLSIVVIPYVVGLFIFQVSIIDAFTNSLPFSWKIVYYEARKRGLTTVYTLYLLPPLILICSFLLQILVKRLHFIQKRKDRKRKNRKSILLLNLFSSYRHSTGLKWIVESLFLLVITGSIVLFSRNETLRTRFKVDYYAYHKMWPELLTTAQENPDNPLVAHAVNRALYHVGRLGYDMFSWPQHPDYLFLSDKKYKWMYWQIFDVFLELGVVNMAEHTLTECLEGLGDRPMVLQRLALINMVKGDMDSAKIYLVTLSKTLFDAEWANSYIDRLKIDPDLTGDKYIQHLRSLCLKKDCPIHSLFKEKTLLWLLEINSRNHMAYEYLMAWYLLNKQLDKFIHNFERLQNSHYPELPTHYEEAVLIYIFRTREPVKLERHLPSDQKRRQIEDFTRILTNYGQDKQAASRELSKKYRNTYLYYYIFESIGSNN